MAKTKNEYWILGKVNAFDPNEPEAGGLYPTYECINPETDKPFIDRNELLAVVERLNRKYVAEGTDLRAAASPRKMPFPPYNQTTP